MHVRGSRLFLRFVWIAAVSLLIAHPAGAGWITLQNLDTGAQPANAVGGGSLDSIVAAAAAWWEATIIDPGYTLTLEYRWTPLASQKANHALLTQGGTPHRETKGRLSFDNDQSFVWFLDPTPFDDEEFSGYQESTLDLGGGPINVERRYTSASGLAAGKFDLFQTALHEIGHVLGMSGANLSFLTEIVDDDIDLLAPLDFAGTSLPVNGAHFDNTLAETLLWGGGLPSNGRRYMTEADILAMVQISQFEDYDLTPAVPEPSTLVLLGLGAVGFLAYVRRTRAARR